MFLRVEDDQYFCGYVLLFIFMLLYIKTQMKVKEKEFFWDRGGFNFMGFVLVLEAGRIYWWRERSGSHKFRVAYFCPILLDKIYTAYATEEYIYLPYTSKSYHNKHTLR